MNETTDAITSQRSAFPWKQGLKPALTLFLTVAASVLVLVLVHSLTSSTIALHGEQQHQAAMESVMPGANVFSEMYCEDPTIDRISGAYDGTSFLGYCVDVTVKSYRGDIHLTVGVSADGRVTGTFIPSHAGPNGTQTAVDTATGKAVTQGIDTALTAVLNYDTEGGPDYEEHG